MKVIEQHATKIASLFALLLALTAKTLCAQSYELPPEVRILTYTNEAYYHKDGSQDWSYPEGNRHGGGYIQTYNATRYSRFGGGMITNFSGYHTYEGGAGYGDWNYYTESRDFTQWFGPCPATAYSWSYWTNSTWWEGMEAPVPDSGYSSGYDTNFNWEPYEARKAYTWENVPWTLIFNSGPPHQGYFEQWNGYTVANTKLELFTGGVTNSTEDVTIQLNVWAYDNLRQRWLTWNEIQVCGRPLDTNSNAYFLWQDNQRTNLSFTFIPTNGLPAGSVNGYDYTFWAHPSRHHVLVGVDKDRSGGIELDGTNDLTSAASPYVFWVNNDNDKLGNPFGDAEIDWFDAASSGASGIANDYAWNIIHTERDLEDFTRVDIRLPAIDWGTNWEVRLTFAGQLKCFELPAPYTGFEHLADQSLANLLVYSNSTQWFIGEAGGGTLLPQRLFTNSSDGVCRLLVKGGAVAAGPLTAEFYRDGWLIGRKRVHLDFRDIKALYEHYTVGNAMTPGVITGLEPATTFSGPAGGHFPEEDGKYLLFVHGWNMPYAEKFFFAETAFKRLYWQGYKGRFGLFTWPTFYFNNFILQDGIINYDKSEQNAWKTGSRLLALLQTLDAAHPGQVRLMAHSMGNVPAGEALRLAGTNQVVFGYVAMQAALSAHCYDASPAVESIGEGGFSWIVMDRSLTTANRYAEYPEDGGLPYLINSAGAGKYHSYFNTSDYALVGLWDLNQRQKPDGSIGYHYSAPSGPNYSGFYRIQTPNTFYLNFPNDTYEIFSFAAESRSVALGASAAVEGVFGRQEAIKLDLNVTQQFTDEHRFHSGQFLSTIIQRNAFWDALATNLKLK